mmetsp:Transcript_18389/g.27929  ORF Transcript_18389/g.27929 Transcript_18389/m.27929 type:complete len:91 (-) Transcript_18389:953-1225(-)
MWMEMGWRHPSTVGRARAPLLDVDDEDDDELLLAFLLAFFFITSASAVFKMERAPSMPPTPAWAHDPPPGKRMDARDESVPELEGGYGLP